MIYLQLFGGLTYLLMGGDLLVRGAVALARQARVSPLVVALSVVAFGTSLPEMVVCVQAVLTEYPGIALGNVVGSNIANVLLVAGAPAIIYPLACNQGSERRDSVVLLVVSLAFAGLCLLGDIDRLAGVALLVGLVGLAGFTGWETVRARERAKRTPLEAVLGLPARKRTITLFIVVGLIALPVGANLFVVGAVGVAERLGVSETVVGLTIVAIGTSLPELATSLVAAIKRQAELTLGTVLGSNAFNLLAIMGVAAVVSPSPIPIPQAVLYLDLPVMLGAALLLALLVWRRPSLGRSSGLLLVVCYALYVIAIFGISR